MGNTVSVHTHTQQQVETAIAKIAKRCGIGADHILHLYINDQQVSLEVWLDPKPLQPILNSSGQPSGDHMLVMHSATPTHAQINWELDMVRISDTAVFLDQ